jgi:hypothetical protein
VSQHERVLSKRTDILEELACVRDEMSTGYMNILRGTIGVARAMARLDEIMLAVAARPAVGCEKPPIPAERPTSAAPATPAARPPEVLPSTQDEARSVRVGKAPDEAPAGDAGTGLTGQSGEFVTRAGAGGESAASADTAPAVDAKPKRTFQQPLPKAEKPAEQPVEPVVPRREPRVLTAGGGLVQGGPVPVATTRDRVLDHYAETGACAKDLAEALGLTVGSVSGQISLGRQAKDPRAANGDAKRAAAIAAPLPALPEGALIVVDVKGERIVGPTGDWKTVDFVAKALAPLADGSMYGVDRMAKASGVKDSVILASLGIWASALAKIGIDLVHTKGIGVKLNRRQVAA